jgi:hypothetical protein
MFRNNAGGFMKNISWVLIAMLALAFFSGSSIAQENGYNPKVQYPGPYQSDVLYVKNSGSTIIRVIPHLDLLKYVTCYNALDHLNSEGKWQGHLRPDGSCGSYDEPAEYTMGNRLNYDGAMVEDNH